MMAAMKRYSLWALLATACTSEQVDLEPAPDKVDEASEYYYLATVGAVEGADPLGLEGSIRQPLVRVRLRGDRDAMSIVDLRGHALAELGGSQIERFTADHIDAIEPKAIEVSREECYRRGGWFIALSACEPSRAVIRHSLLRITAGRNYLPKPASELFAFHRTENGHRVQRNSRTPRYYLAPDVLPHEAETVRNAAAAYAIEIRDNDCRPEVIRRYRDLEEGADLAAICAELERNTDSAFTWQRPGSLAADTISFLRKPGPWGAYAPRAVDAETGELVAGSIFIRAQTFESAAARAAASIEADLDDEPVFDSAHAFRLADERRAQRLGERASDAFLARIGEQLRAPKARIPGKSFSSLNEVVVPSTFDLPTIADVFEGTGASMQPVSLAPHVSALLRAEGLSTLSITKSPERAAALAGLSGEGYAFLRDDRDPHYERLAAQNVMEALPALLQHAVSKSFALSLGLAPNFAGSFDGGINLSSSVLDALPAEAQVAMIEPGEYDLAALDFAYGELAGPKNYQYCTADQAYQTPTTRCQSGDLGTSPVEIFANFERRWDGEYRFYSFDIDPRQKAEFPLRVFEPAHAPLAYAMLAAKELTAGVRADPSFPATEEARALLTVAAQGLNFAARVIHVPEPGRNCELEGVLIPFVYLQECDPDADIDAPASRALGMVDISAGEGRGPRAYADFDTHRTPTQYRHDRLAVFWMLEPDFADLFMPELRRLLIKTIGGHSLQVKLTKDLAPRWCGDRLEPARLIDPQSGERPVEPATGCAGAPAVFVPDFAELEYYGPFFLQAQLGAFIEELEIHTELEGGEGELCEVIDTFDGDQRYAASRTRNPIACALIDIAAETVGQAQGSNPLFDAWARAALARVRYLAALTAAR